MPSLSRLLTPLLRAIAVAVWDERDRRDRAEAAYHHAADRTMYSREQALVPVDERRQAAHEAGMAAYRESYSGASPIDTSPSGWRWS